MARTTVATLVILFTCATAARAQDDSRFGLTMGYPASIGVLWRVSDRVAVRPEVSFTKTNTESTAVTTIFGPGGPTTFTSQVTNDSWNVGTGASLLVNVGRWESLRSYVSPRFAYTRSTSTTTPPSSPVGSLPQSSTEVTATTYFVSGSFGAEYTLGRRFGVFGEVGLGYSRIKTTAGQSIGGNLTSRVFGSRSGAGVILFF
jgi:opacity protein-like surface antigen